DAARLPEVDRAEVEAVDDRRGGAAGLEDALLPGLVLLGCRGPGDVVDGAGAGDALLVRGVVRVEPAAPLTARLPGLAVPRELERLEEAAAPLRVARIGVDGVEALQRVLLRNLRVVGDQRLVVRLDRDQPVPQALGIGEREPASVVTLLRPPALISGRPGIAEAFLMRAPPGSADRKADPMGLSSRAFRTRSRLLLVSLLTATALTGVLSGSVGARTSAPTFGVPLYLDQ